MTETILGIPAILVTFGLVLVGVVGGALYLIGIFSKDKLNRTSTEMKDAKLASEFVISSLEKKIALLEQRITEQERLLLETNKKVSVLIEENKILRDVLQGRDIETQRFQKIGFEVMEKIIPQIFEITLKTSTNVERLYDAIEKHLAILEKGQTVTVTTGGN